MNLYTKLPVGFRVALLINANEYSIKKFLGFDTLRIYGYKSFNAFHERRGFFSCFCTIAVRFLPKIVAMSHFLSLATVPRQAVFVENPQKALRQNAGKFYLYTFRRNFDVKIVQFGYLQIRSMGV